MVRPEELDAYKVGSLPTIFYIPEYLSPEDQLGLLQQINVGSSTKWKSLKNRRLQNWGGVVHEKGLLPQKLPPWLSDLTGNICRDLGLYPAPINHVLINEYLPGQGIMQHQDGPAYFPVVAILSLGSPAVMQFTPHQKLFEMAGDVGKMHSTTHEGVSLVLMPGSLLVFRDVAYQDFLHGIDECTEHKVDRSTVNLNKLEAFGTGVCNFQVPTVIPDDSVEDVEKFSDVEHNEEVTKKDFLGIVKRNGTRVSLTCRLVTKVHKNLFRT